MPTVEQSSILALSIRAVLNLTATETIVISISQLASVKSFQKPARLLIKISIYIIALEGISAVNYMLKLFNKRHFLPNPLNLAIDILYLDTINLIRTQLQTNIIDPYWRTP